MTVGWVRGYYSITAPSVLNESVCSTFVSHWHPLTCIILSGSWHDYPSTVAFFVVSIFLVSHHMVQVPSVDVTLSKTRNFLGASFWLSSVLQSSQARKTLGWDSGLSSRASACLWYLTSIFPLCSSTVKWRLPSSFFFPSEFLVGKKAVSPLLLY